MSQPLLDRNDKLLIWPLIILGFLWLTFSDNLRLLWDDMTAEQPWFEARLELIQDDTGAVFVLYDRTMRRSMDGRWDAWIKQEGSRVICSGDGRDSYHPAESGTDLMSLRYFLGRDCEIPGNPVIVCATWVMETIGARMQRLFGPVCSAPVDLKRRP